MSLEEFNHSDLDNFLRDLTDTPVPLASHTPTDPFHMAQIMQKGIATARSAVLIGEKEPEQLDDESVQELMSELALAELNAKFLHDLRDKRIAIVTAHVFAIYSKEHRPQEPYFSDISVISGKMHGFHFTPVPDADSDKVLVAHLTEPRYLDPDFIDASRYHGVVVPVMDIHDWSPHFNVK